MSYSYVHNMRGEGRRGKRVWREEKGGTGVEEEGEVGENSA